MKTKHRRFDEIWKSNERDEVAKLIIWQVKRLHVIMTLSVVFTLSISCLWLILIVSLSSNENDWDSMSSKDIDQRRNTSFGYHKKFAFQYWFSHRTRACRRDLSQFFLKRKKFNNKYPTIFQKSKKIWFSS